MNKSKAVRPISVRNAQRKLPVGVQALQTFSARAWQEAVRKAPRNAADISPLEAIDVVLVSDRRITALHKRFMGIEGATDVITFQHGEIVISVETAARQARELGNSFEAEVRLYIVHGLLHLLGFDDRNSKDAQLMERTQGEVIAAVCNAA